MRFLLKRCCQCFKRDAEKDAGIHAVVFTTLTEANASNPNIHAENSFLHYSSRNLQQSIQSPTRSKTAFCEVVYEQMGTTTWAAREKTCAADKVGTMIAGNSGRPAGACGGTGNVMNIHAGHKTQEEDIVSNWMFTLSNGEENPTLWNTTFQATIDRKVGNARSAWNIVRNHSGCELPGSG